MKRKKLTSVLGILLPLIILVGLVPVTVLAQDNEYVFLNPMGVVQPRTETPLADRNRVTDILNAEGPRTLRIGVTWYYKPLDGEQPYATARLLKARWEAESNVPDADGKTKYPPGLTVQFITPDPAQSATYYSMLPAPGSGYIPYMGHAWNLKDDAVYNAMEEACDAIMIGTGD